MIRVENIAKQYAGKLILSGINFRVNHAETLSVLGRSGSGKTTLLKIIAGLELPESGEVFFDERAGSRLNPSERNTVYLYQESLLFPHLNVVQNIAFGLTLRKVSKQLIKNQTDKLVNELELNEHRNKMPHELSGGQKQRVAFGRAMIIEPRLLLLDEPFGSLDLETRTSMQALFKKMTGEYKITTVFVTHDLKEAILMGDRIAYLLPDGIEVYDQISDFINDGKTGVNEEIEFWKGLKV